MKKKLVSVLGIFLAISITACGNGAASATKSADYAAEAEYAVESAADEGNASPALGFAQDTADYESYDTPAVAGAAQNGDNSQDKSDEAQADNGDNSGDTSADATGTTTSPDSSQPSYTDTRKLIRTVSINAETENLDTIIGLIRQKTNELGGYIENSDTSQRATETATYRYSNYTVRVPADKLDQFTDAVKGDLNVLSMTENVDDVTLNYVDTTTRKQTLLTERERLLEFLASAESVEDMLAIEDRLTELQYELQSTESQIRTYDSKVNYATVYISLTEVKEFTPVEVKKDGPFERMKNGFVKSLKGVGNFFLELLIAIVSNLPQLLIFAALIFAIVKLIKKIIKAEDEKMKKAMKQQIPMQPVPVQQMAPVQQQAQQAQPAQPVQQPTQETEKKEQ